MDQRQEMSVNTFTNGLSCVFNAIVAVCAIVTTCLVYSQTPFYHASPTLTYSVATSNSNVRDADGKYTSIIKMTVTNWDRQPAREVRAVVCPIPGGKWTICSN